MPEEKHKGQQDDFALLAQFNEGSQDSFTRLVEKHSGSLINFLHRYTQNQGTSEDIAQEAFLRLLKAAAGLKPGTAKLSTILYKIAYNLAVDEARKNKSRSVKAPAQSLNASGAPDPAENASSAPDAIYAANQQNKEIAAGLAGLPDNQRLALILKVYENRSYSEIAEIMDLSVSSIESLLFRARQSLSKKLK